jgi:probable phosphoglycerate mutase
MLAYIVRHAESLRNAGSASSLNSGLTPLGRDQAAALARRLGVIDFTAVYSSPYERCLQTASAIVSRSGAEIRIRAELFECHHLPPGQTVDTDLPPLDVLLGGWPSVRPCPDGPQEPEWPALDESANELFARMRRMATYLQARWTGLDDAVLVVTHGSPAARLIEAWLLVAPGPSYRFVVDCGTVSAVRYLDGVSSLLCLNDVSHLAGLPVPGISNYDAGGAFKARRPAGPS